MIISRKQFFPFLTERGFSYSQSYEKQSDSACVLQYRFTGGSGFIEFRQLVGEKKINCVVYCDGKYRFPSLEGRDKTLARAFRLRHLFRAPTEEELWRQTAELVKSELSRDPALFGLLG